METSANERTPLIGDYKDDEQPGPSGNVRASAVIPEGLRNRRLQLEPRAGRWGFGFDQINDGSGRLVPFHEWVDSECKEYYRLLAEQRRRQLEPVPDEEGSECGRKCCEFVFNKYSMLTLSIAVAIVSAPFYMTWNSSIEHEMHRNQRSYVGAIISTVLLYLVILGTTWILVIAALKLLRGCYKGLHKKFKDIFGSRRSSVGSGDVENQ